MLISFAILFCTVILGGYAAYAEMSKAASYFCENAILNVKPQPERAYDLVYFQRDCGATTGYSYHLSILKHGEGLPNRKGNVFVSDQAFDAYWKNNKTIVVSGDFEKVFKQTKSYNGIKIEYNCPSWP